MFILLFWTNRNLAGGGKSSSKSSPQIVPRPAAFKMAPQHGRRVAKIRRAAGMGNGALAIISEGDSRSRLTRKRVNLKRSHSNAKLQGWVKA